MMAKYDPLRDYLMRQTLTELILTFREVENIIGDRLPSTASTPQWWENVKGQHGHVQREAWRAAGYEAFFVSPNRARFVRVS
jgi:hypothetical protein